MRKGRWGKLMQWILDLVYPPKCIFCGELLEPEEQGACRTCWAELPHTTPTTVCQCGEGFTQCVSPFFLEGKVHQALIQYKFHRRESYSVSLGRWMGVCARHYLSGHFDSITWVPVSQKRLRERGFDQSLLLATEVARQYGMRPERTLDKTKNTPALSKSGGGAKMRKQLVAGVYQLHPGCDLTGKRILLVDDIITTGSTLSEAAAVLRRAGAAEICCVTAARGQLPAEKQGEALQGEQVES